MRRYIVIFATVLVAAFCVKSVYADNANRSGKEDVMAFVDKYKAVDGFDANTFVKGEGLGFLKSMLNKQFGKSFMKGVDIVTMIDYSKVPASVRDSIRYDYDRIFSKFNEVEIPDSTKKEAYVRCLFKRQNEGSDITDFITITEDKEAGVFFYMGGLIPEKEFQKIAE